MHILYFSPLEMDALIRAALPSMGSTSHALNGPHSSCTTSVSCRTGSAATAPSKNGCSTSGPTSSDTASTISGHMLPTIGVSQQKTSPTILTQPVLRLTSTSLLISQEVRRFRKISAQVVSCPFIVFHAPIPNCIVIISSCNRRSMALTTTYFSVFTGPRYYANKLHNALTCAAHFGDVHNIIFVTITYTPDSATTRALSGNTSSDNDPITMTRTFQVKREKVQSDITAGRYSPPSSRGKAATYGLNVNEWQARAFPHAHSIDRFSGAAFFLLSSLHTLVSYLPRVLPHRQKSCHVTSSLQALIGLHLTWTPFSGRTSPLLQKNCSTRA